MTHNIAANAPKELASSLHQLGTQAHERGDTELAKTLWTQAIARDSSVSEYHESLADALTKEGAHALAEPHWRSAHALKPTQPSLANGLGVSLLMQNKADEAVGYLKKGQQANPPSAKALEACRQEVELAQTMNNNRGSQAVRDGLLAQGATMHSVPTARLPGVTIATIGDPLGNQVANHARLQNMAATSQLGNTSSEQVREEFSGFNEASFPTFPPALARLGVPRAMFDADMAALKKISKDAHDYRDESIALLCFTCCLYMVVDCFKPSWSQVYMKNAKAKIDEMNTRYAQYGVTWNFKAISGVGPFIRYET